MRSRLKEIKSYPPPTKKTNKRDRQMTVSFNARFIAEDCGYLLNHCKRKPYEQIICPCISTAVNQDKDIFCTNVHLNHKLSEIFFFTFVLIYSLQFIIICFLRLCPLHENEQVLAEHGVVFTLDFLFFFFLFSSPHIHFQTSILFPA